MVTLFQFFRHPIRHYKRLVFLEEQIATIHMDAQNVHQWCAHSPRVAQTAKRYEKMSSDKWRKIPFSDVSNFRKDLGLCPWSSPNPDKEKRPE